MLFNLYPEAKERLRSTTARDHAFHVGGLYALEERVFRKVGLFREVGLRRPKEGRWDLVFQTFVLMLLLLFSVFFGGLALLVGMAWEITVQATSEEEVTWEVTSKDPGGVNMIPPEVQSLFYALPAIIFFIASVVLLKRIIIAWRRRNRPASA
jgi:hypothetical protein